MVVNGCHTCLCTWLFHGYIICSVLTYMCTSRLVTVVVEERGQNGRVFGSPLMIVVGGYEEGGYC